MISFTIGNDKFNYRVSGIFIDSSSQRFLTNTSEDVEFFVLPGGRVEMGEDTSQTLLREIMEELGEQIEIVCLKAITEDFFEFNSINFHEIQFMYVAKFKNKDIENHSDSFKGLENKDIYKWQNINDLKDLDYRPKHMKPIIKEAFEGDYSLKHIIFRENDNY